MTHSSKSLLALVFTLFLSGCSHKAIVRDLDVYKAELNQYDNWAAKQAGLLRKFVTLHCECSVDGKFVLGDCTLAADWLLTVEARHAWHKAMSLYNAGITEDRPSETPPAIPASSCPLPTGAE